MGHLIAAAGAVEVGRLRARRTSRRDAESTRTSSTRDPDCDLNFVTGAAAPAAHPRGDVQLVRVRRLEQLRRGPQPRGGRRCRRCLLTWRSASHDAPRTNRRHRDGRRVRGRSDARRHPRRGARGALGDRADPAVGHDRLAVPRRGRDPRLQSARDGRGPQAAQADPAHRSARPLRRGTRDRARRRSSPTAVRSTPARPPSTATAPASSSARAAATTRTSTTTSRC